MIESLYEENFAQGKLEKTLQLELTPLVDEENVSYYLLFIIKPVYTMNFIKGAVIGTSLHTRLPPGGGDKSSEQIKHPGIDLSPPPGGDRG